MDIEEAASKDAQFKGLWWVIAFVWCGLVFIERITDFKRSDHVVPVEPLQWVWRGSAVLFCLLPLVASYSFRRLLKREMEKGSLSARMFAMCDWGIALLVSSAYLGMLRF